MAAKKKKKRLRPRTTRHEARLRSVNLRLGKALASADARGFLRIHGSHFDDPDVRRLMAERDEILRKKSRS